MEIYKIADYVSRKNPEPGKRQTVQILTEAQQSATIRGIFSLLEPGNRVGYHFHNKRESVIIAIKGKATEIVEGKQYPVTAGDIIFIPAKEKHGLVNTSKEDFRYLEFYDWSGEKDRVDLEWPAGIP